MKVLFPVVRLVIAAGIVAACSYLILNIGRLPVAPHAIADGPHQGTLRVYSVIWWFALASAVGAATAVGFALVERYTKVKLPRFIRDALGIVYFFVAAAALASFVFDFALSTLFATSSIIAVILGFALQNTLADLFSGLAMNIEQPFRVGDRIELGDRPGGRVFGMNWRATHIVTSAGDLVVVPNSLLSRSRITNHDSPVAPVKRYPVTIKLGNNIPPARAIDILRAAALSAKGVLDSPVPRVEIAGYGDWAIDYKILFYFSDWGDDTKIASRVYEAVWSHLSWAGIAQPAPRTVTTQAAPGDDAPASLPTLLKRVDVFAPLADAERATLAAQMRLLSVAAGDRVITQGESGRSLFVVREGIFDVSVREGDDEHVVGRLYPGDYLGEASLLTGAARGASVKAVTGAAVYEIDKDHFQPFLNARPEMTETLAAALAARSNHRNGPADAAAQTVLTAFANQIRSFFRV